MKKVLKGILYGAFVIELAWMLLSFLEIAILNLTLNPQYSAYNFFTLFFV